MSEALEFAVVSPAGRYAGRDVQFAQRLETLDAKRVAFLWNHLFRGDLMFEQIGRQLRESWPSVELVDHGPFGNFHGAEEPKVMAELAEKLKAAQVEAVVVGVGACGACTPAVVRACAVAERSGIPAVGLVAEGFERQAHAIATALGLKTAVLARYPGVVMTDSLPTFHSKVEQKMVPEAVAGLFRPDFRGGGAEGASRERYERDAVVFSGTLDGVQGFFESRLWTDGLPVMPPTIDAVSRMLEHTKRDPEEVLGVLLPANQEATVWSVAVNGVMAGCDPRHLPVLIAIVENLSKRNFGLEHIGATPGWEGVGIVSGPDLDLLGFNSAAGALRAGARANTAIGRFMKLVIRNVAGVVGPPGETDKATLGAPTHGVLSESETATREIGWPTFREEAGFGAEDTTVTVQSVIGYSLPIYTEGDDADPHLRVLAEHIAGASGHWSALGLMFNEWQPLLVMSPSIAGVLARSGMSKDDVRRELANRARVPLSQWRRSVTAVGLQLSDLDGRFRDGTARAEYHESTDPDRLVPVIPFPERLAIIVAGDPARNQSKYYVNNHVQGPRVTERVRW